MRDLAISGLLFAAMVFLLNACASNSGVVTESASTGTAAPVPGEKIPDDGAVVPGGMGNPNANVRW
jgi:hypothetical protein